MKGVNKNFIVDFKYMFKLNIHRGILEYLAGFKAGEIWQKRGLAGHKKIDMSKIRNKRIKIIKDKFNNDNDFKNNLNDFLKEVNSLFDALLSGKSEVVNKYIFQTVSFILL